MCISLSSLCSIVQFLLLPVCSAHGLSSFQAGDTKLEKNLPWDSNIFDMENWLWKSNLNFVTFWQLAITPILKIQSFPLGMLIFKQKCFQFCTPTWKLNNPYYHTTHGPCITLLLVWEKVILFKFGLVILWAEHLAKSLIPSPVLHCLETLC